MTAIKICGITTEQEALWLNEAAVDYAGFVFYEKSRRNVSIRKAQQIFGKLNKSIKKVAVTVSPDQTKLSQLETAGFDIIQIHGIWKDNYLNLTKLPVWRAVNIKSIKEIQRIRGETENKKLPQALIADAGEFGSGRTFGWEHTIGEQQEEFLDCRSYFRKKGLLFVLAGGLNSGNVEKAIRLFHPDVVDVSSGVEADGRAFMGKDRKKINIFCEKCRKEG